MEQMPRQDAPKQVYEAAWPDMFASLQTAYAELTRAQFEPRARTAEMKAGRDLFYEVIESMSEAWLLIDRAGHVERVNPAATALLECEEAELVGRPSPKSVAAIPFRSPHGNSLSVPLMGDWPTLTSRSRLRPAASCP